ncbi:MAG: UDP-3-O-acyl-N-acetylglucosamine deacetylase [Myxococcota bacterium]|nr:UDP-3-O-acyl-N-acetylglucosamine deacetylase [Myxococcota bacterium]
MFAPFSKSGIGLHTGRPSSITVEMGAPGTGIVFIMNDGRIPATPVSIDDNGCLATTLRSCGNALHTVEHLMAALAAYGETDVRVTVDGDEIPILDGSALGWAEALKDRGAAPPPRFVHISRPIEVTDGDSRAQLTPLPPDGSPLIRVTVDFSESCRIGCQEAAFYPLKDNFLNDVAGARTFAFASDVPSILASNRGLGGALDNALIIGPAGPLNPEGWRFPNELARHKLLDALGDLFLLGGIPWADIVLRKPGHRLVHALARRALPFCRAADDVPAGGTP